MNCRPIEMALCLARGAVSHGLPDAHARLNEAQAQVVRARATVYSPSGLRCCPRCGGYEAYCRWCAAADRAIARLPDWEAEVTRLRAALEVS